MRRLFLLGGVMSTVFTTACGANSDEKSRGVQDDAGAGEFAKGVADPCTTHPLHTGFLNDEICLEPPAPDVGDQIHYGPAFGADYEDPDVIAPYVLPPGSGDKVKCLFSETNNEEEKYSFEYHTRARTGTHHVIMWMGVTEDAARGPVGTFADQCRGLPGQTFFPGTQAGLGKEGARLDVPVGGIRAPEDEGSARRILPHAPISIEVHYVNITEEAMLAEVWMNVAYMPKSDVKVLMDPIFLLGGLNANVGYGQTQITGVDKVAPPPTGDEEARIMGFAAHSHAHTRRVTAWINRADTGERQYVYETYDWAEPLNATFDTLHKNRPVTGMGGKEEAAFSGILTMGKQDTFGWECEVENDDLPNVRLTFGDGAYDKEMCNIFGFFGPGSGTGLWVAPLSNAYSR